MTLGALDPGRAYKSSEAAVGWLYGQVLADSINVGYRSLVLSGSTRSVTVTGPVDAWSFLSALDAAIAPSNWDVNVNGSEIWLGRVGVSRTVTWLDRLGWLLGYDTEPGEVEAATEALYPRQPSPIAVPLLSCSREDLTREQARQLDLDRFGRGFGNGFGDAELRRFRVQLDRPGFEALRAGWCLTGGVVTLSPYTLAQHLAGTVTAFSESSPVGYHRGRIVGVEGGDWIDAEGPHRLYETTLVLAAEVT